MLWHYGTMDHYIMLCSPPQVCWCHSVDFCPGWTCNHLCTCTIYHLFFSQHGTISFQLRWCWRYSFRRTWRGQCFTAQQWSDYNWRNAGVAAYLFFLSSDSLIFILAITFVFIFIESHLGCDLEGRCNIGTVCTKLQDLTLLFLTISPTGPIFSFLLLHRLVI